jgi:hypothetical protein
MPSIPSPPPVAPPPPPVASAQEVDQATKMGRQKERKRIAAARGRGDTVLTGLLSEGKTRKPTLLGA